MTDPAPTHGRILFHDLTVPDAEAVRDFYARVAGWTAEPLSMGDYDDYVMSAPDGTPVAGICHARGPNSDLPAAWMMYVDVPDLEAALDDARELGGLVVAGPKGEAPGARFAVVRDPAGALVALRQEATTPHG